MGKIKKILSEKHSGESELTSAIAILTGFLLLCLLFRTQITAFFTAIVNAVKR